MFYDVFIDLCKRNNEKPYVVAMELGAKSNSIVGQWKKGSVPRQPLLHKIAEHFHVSEAYLLEMEIDERIAIERAKTALDEAVSENPNLPSGKRLEILFNASGYDIDVVCFNLSLDTKAVMRWMDYDEMPDQQTVDKLCGVFLITLDRLIPAKKQPIDFDGLSDAELQIIQIFRSLPEAYRQALLAQVQALIPFQQAPDNPAKTKVIPAHPGSA